MGAHIGDHLRATVHNLEGRVPYLEQSVYFDDLPPGAVDAVRDDLRHLGEQVLQEAYQRIARAEQAGRAERTERQGGDKKRLRLGVYYYEEVTQSSRPEGDAQ
jgi:hypothetical protein